MTEDKNPTNNQVNPLCNVNEKKSNVIECGQLDFSKNNMDVKTNSTTGTNNTEFVPDSGWSWIVAIGSAIVQMQLAPLGTTFGIYYVEFSKQYEVNAAIMSWIPALFSLIGFATSPLASALSKIYSHKTISLLGCTLVIAAFLSMYFIKNFYYITFAYGILGGFGTGLSIIQGSLCVQKHFDKKRSIANGLYMSGGALGSIIMPIILRHSLSSLGLQNAILVHTACIFTSIPASLTFFPVSDKPFNEKQQRKTAVLFISEIFSLSILRNPLFQIIVLSIAFGRMSLRGVSMITPAFAEEEIQIDKYFSAYLLSIMGIGDFVARFLMPLVGQYVLSSVSNKCIYISGILLQALSCAAIGLFVDDFFTILVFIVLFGFGSGIIVVYMNIIMVEHLGQSTIHDSFGLMYFFTGISCAIIIPIMGFLNNITESFRTSYVVLSCILMCGLLGWTFETNAKKFLRKQELSH